MPRRGCCFVGSTDIHPCVAGGVDGFLSRVVNEVVDYLGNSDVPSRVFRDGINRRVSNAVTKIMGVMLVKGHRWPTTIGSILSRTAHVLFKESALSVMHGRLFALGVFLFPPSPSRRLRGPSPAVGAVSACRLGFIPDSPSPKAALMVPFAKLIGFIPPTHRFTQNLNVPPAPNENKQHKQSRRRKQPIDYTEFIQGRRVLGLICCDG